MKAAVLRGPDDLDLAAQFPDPRPGPRDAVIRVGATTLCGTDSRILRGEKTAGVRSGVVLGHEIAGYVEEIGSGDNPLRVGELVSVIPTVPCTRCAYCREGLTNLCQSPHLFGYDLDGGLAERMLLPAAAISRGAVAPAAKTLAPEEAALAEPLSCVLNGLGQYRPHLGDTALIIGAGPIGLLHLQAMRRAGVTRVIISDPNASRREAALDLGATHVLNPDEEDVIERVAALTDDVGTDLVLLAIGAPALVNTALRCVRKRGCVSMFAGFPKDALAQIDVNLVHYKELTVVGASNSTAKTHRLALDLIAQGTIDVKSLVTARFPLEAVSDALTAATHGAQLKVAVTP